MEPTELAGAAEADTESVAAWSLAEPDDYPTQRLTPRRITTIGVIGSVVLVSAAGWLLHNKLSEASSTASTVVTVVQQSAAPPPPVMPAPPVTVTQTIAPQLSANSDARFLDLMREAGWNVTDPSIAIRTARSFCDQIRQGVSLETATRQIAAKAPTDIENARVVASNAMLAYGCRGQSS